MKSYYKCQSCALPLKKDEMRGTERNREKSLMYCKFCYQDGEFTQKNITVTEMKQQVKNQCIELGSSVILATMISKGIPKLERWKRK